MTALELKDWVRRQGPGLDRRGVHVHHAAGPRLNEDGASWVSFSSTTGTGRLVRATDGSSTSKAHRYADGAILVDTADASTTEAHLTRLADALG